MLVPYNDSIAAPLPLINQLAKVLGILQETGGIIGGGFVRSYLRGGPLAEDIDIFTTNESMYNRVCMALKELPMFEVHETEADSKIWGAKTFMQSSDYPLGNLIPSMVQVIKPMPDIHDVHQLAETFDFTITQAFILSTGSVLVHKDFVSDCYLKRLVVENVRFPLGTLKRAFKYVQKGFNIEPTELVKLMDAWANVPAEIKPKMIERANLTVYGLTI